MKTTVLFLVLMICAATVLAQIPRTISYQGVLTDTAGYPKRDSTYSITFRLYESQSGGTSVWMETKNLATKRGLFSTLLGDVVPFSTPSGGVAGGAEIAQSTTGITFGQQYWLGIQVGNDPELSPRTTLSAVPYSMTAIKADTAAYSLSSAAGECKWTENGTNIFYSLGNVGVGTTTPAQRLDVDGNLRIPSTTTTKGIIYQGSDPFLHSYPHLTNFFAGVRAGNLTMEGGPMKVDNTGIGHEALRNNVSGGGNTAVGTYALRSNTTGSVNTACGASALADALGYANSALGANTLLSSRGNENTAIGFNALISNGSGSGNTGIGCFADVSGDITNATAIGYSAVVSQSNSLVLGGTDIYAVKVGVGTSTPRGVLDVIGSTTAANKTAASLFLKTGNATNDGGDFSFNTGVGTAWPTSGGSYNFTAANGSLGGSFNFTAGAGSDFNGGSFNMTAGNSVGGAGGGLSLRAGTGSPGGGITLRSGDGANTAGNIELRGGTSGSGPGGNIIFRPGGGLGGAMGYVSFPSGTVGVGISGTPTAKLEVSGTAKATTLLATSRAGIATTNPIALLHVAGDTTRQGGNGDSVLIFSSGNNNGAAGSIRLRSGDGIGGGGSIGLRAGDAFDMRGGNITMECGSGGHGGIGYGGSFLLKAGWSSGGPVGGGFTFTAGGSDLQSSDGVGGGFQFKGGRSWGHGGDFTVEAGEGQTYGGNINLSAGGSWGAFWDPPFGGNVNFKAGPGQVVAGGFTFTPGAGPGGAYGNFRIINLATGGGTTLVIDNDGNLRKQSSSLRFKDNVSNLIANPEAVLKLRPVSFRWRSTGTQDIGLIAEEVEQQIADLVIHDSDGKPEGVKYDRLALYLLELLKEQKKEISLLKQRLERIEQNTGR